jgi:transcriptional regulator with XRE-family HTH domain
MTPGRLLREARHAHRVTQKQLANRAGTTQSAISRIERDRISPTIETLATLLHLLGRELVLETKDDTWAGDRTLLRHNLDLSPAERLAQATGWANFARTHRGALHRGA